MQIFNIQRHISLEYLVYAMYLTTTIRAPKALSQSYLKSTMDPTFYKDHTTSRGYNYHYYRVLPKDNNINLVFIHGFPSTSHDWRLIVPYFQAKGCGVIVPDMLGYRGTDKPTDFKEYQYSLLTRDVVDIMDEEGVERAVAIGHDW